MPASSPIGGVHYLDIAQWGCPEITAKPFTIEGKGEFPASGMTDTCIGWDVMLSYASGLKVHFSDYGKQRAGCRFIGDEGWVCVNWNSGWSGFTASSPAYRYVQFKDTDVRLHTSPATPGNNPYTNHTRDLFDCMRSRQDPVAPFEQGHRATTIGNVADITVRLKRKLKWDWDTETFDDEEANSMRSRPLREPYSI